MDPIKVFISYTHDSREHQLRILGLSNRLRREGLDCHIDQYEVNPREGWPLWMERRVREASFVLVACTPVYRRRFCGEEAKGVGLGAAYESILARALILTSDADKKFEKFIVVLFSRSDREHVPEILQTAAQYCLEDQDGYERLVHHLLGIPEAEKPPLGTMRLQSRPNPLPALPSKAEFLSLKLDRVIHYPIGAPADLPITVSRHPIPRSNLPPRLALLGRADEIGQLMQDVRANTAFVAITGARGCGKSALLLDAAHEVIGLHNHHLIIWLPAGEDGIRLDEAYDAIGKTASAQYVTRLSLQEKHAQVERILSAGPSILFIPHFDRITDPSARSVLTSLSRFAQVIVSTSASCPDLAHELKLQPLSDSVALAFATNELNRRDSAEISTEELQQLCLDCRGYPVAIQWAIAWWNRPDFRTVITTVGRQSDPSLLVERLFGAVWPLLSPLCRRACAAMRLFPGGASIEALKAVVSDGSEDIEAAIAELTIYRFVSPLGKDRFILNHPVSDLLGTARPDRWGEDISSLELAVVKHFRRYVERFGGIGRTASVPLIERERVNIVRALETCIRHGWSRDFLELQRHIYHMLWACDYWNANLDFGHKALDYATTLEAREEAFWAHLECLGWTYFCRGDYTQAHLHYDSAKAVLDEFDAQPDARARLFNYLGRLAAAEEDYDGALDVLWQGLRHAESDVTTAFLESALADIHYLRREVPLALAHYRSVQVVREETADEFRLCSVLCDIAEVSIEMGDIDAAYRGFSQSLSIASKTGRLEVAARCHYGLGLTALATKKVSSASRHLNAALTAFEQLGRDRECERVRALLPEAQSPADYSLDIFKPAAGSSAEKLEVLLVNAPRSAEGRRLSSQDRRMPLGLMTISAFLKRRGVRCRVIDAEATGCGLSGVLDAVLSTRPDIVGLNCHTLNRKLVYEIVRELRTAVPGVTVVLGGAHPTLAPEMTMSECPEAHFIVVGEGERVLYEMCRRRESAHLVPGVCCRHDGVILKNPPMPRIQNLDIVGFPDLEGLPIDDYIGYEEPALPGMWHRAYLSATRGCKYRCGYCTEHVFWKRDLTHRSAESVMREIEHYVRDHGVRRFYFYDDTFTDWVGLNDFCTLAGDASIEWSCSTRSDAITAPLVEEFQRAGCREIAFGLESGAWRSLARMSKGLQLSAAVIDGADSSRLWEEIGARIQLCSNARITARTHFMIGFAWETKQDITDTVSLAVFLKQFGLTDANFFVVKTYPGTSLHSSNIRLQVEQQIRDSEVYDAWSVEDSLTTRNPQARAKLRRFNDIPAISMHPVLDSLSLRRLVRNAYEVFFNHYSLQSVPDLLWREVEWRDAADRIETAPLTRGMTAGG